MSKVRIRLQLLLVFRLNVKGDASYFFKCIYIQQGWWWCSVTQSCLILLQPRGL